MNGKPTQELMDAQASTETLNRFGHDDHDDWICSYPYIGTIPRLKRRGRLLSFQEATIIAKHYSDRARKNDDGEIATEMTLSQAISLLNKRSHNNYSLWQAQKDYVTTVRGNKIERYSEFDVIAMAEKLERNGH